MSRVRSVAGLVVVASLFSSCIPSNAIGLEVNLNLAPDDFARFRSYRQGTASTAYGESLSYEATVGALKAGDLVHIRINLLQPVLIENYTGATYGVTMQLAKSAPPPMNVQAYSSSLTLPNLLNAEAISQQAYGSTSILTWFSQPATVGVLPTSNIARIGAIDWTYTAPNWTPTNSSVDLDVVIHMERAEVVSFPEPDHLFLTFVPEPGMAVLLASAVPTLIAVRRRRGMK